MKSLRPIFFAVLLAFCALGALDARAEQVRGRITDIDGRPLKDVAVTAPALHLKTFSDESGEFTFEVAASAGEIRLLFEAPGFYGESIAFDAQKQAAEIEVTLTPVKVIRQEVRVVAPRLDIPLSATPAAASLVGLDTLEVMPRAMAVDETLRGVPGVKVDNQANGERVHLSIRGQGILTERGIRGVQVLLDGLPLNDPSGFVPDLFDVEWASVQEMEVVRGPVAFLYGGGSTGGVIDISTRAATDTLHGAFSTSGGSNGFYKTRGEVSGTARGVAYFIAGSRGAGDGYREHTAFWANNAYGKVSFNPTSRLHLNAMLFGTGFFNQNAEGLNLVWLAQDRRMAKSRCPHLQRVPEDAASDRRSDRTMDRNGKTARLLHVLRAPHGVPRAGSLFGGAPHARIARRVGAVRLGPGHGLVQTPSQHRPRPRPPVH